MPDYTDRQHPYRLSAEDYRAPDVIFFLSVRAKDCPSLAAPPLADEILAVMGRIGRRAGTSIHAYCLMPDHFHALASVTEHGGDVARCLRYTKREAAKVTGRPGMWQRSWWDHYTRNDKDLAIRTDYLLREKK